MVDLSVILPTLNAEALAVGTWVSVIGYARIDPALKRRTVEAVAMWNVGPKAAKPLDYEKIVSERKEAMSKMQTAREAAGL